MNRELYLTLLLFTATVLALWGFLLVLSPFLGPIAWALCLAAITLVPYRRLARATGRPHLSALIMVVATAIAILVPLAVVLLMAGQELVRLGETGLNEWVADLQEALPGVYAWVDARLIELGADGIESSASKIGEAAPGLLWRPVATGAWTVVGGVFTALMGLVIMLATQYFVYAEAPRLQGAVRDFSPLSGESTDKILRTLRETTSAAVLGGIVVALVQGLLAGLGYMIVGMQAPILWAMVTALFSLLPVGGSALVWGPMVIYLFAAGSTGYAWFLLIWGVILVGSIDNVMRPWVLMRSGSRVHPMLLFFAILSGIGLFGMSGIVFGPLLIAFLMTTAQIYREHVADVPQGDETPGAAEAGADA